MISTFNIAKLRELLKSFYTVTQIRITVFDENYQEIVSYPPQVPSFCSLIRSTSEGRKNCFMCDNHACEYVNKNQKIHIYQCHAGLTESIVPIVLGGIIIGYLLFGHITPYEDMKEGWTIVYRCCKDYGIDMAQLEKAYYERLYFPDHYIESSSQIMNVVASYICVSHMASLKYDILPFKIDQYIQNHISDDMSSNTLCEHFQISRTKLYQVSSDNFGTGITNYIRRARILESARLLVETSLPVNQIATAVGIYDYNYFTKVFKKHFGVTPRDYRKHRNNN